MLLVPVLLIALLLGHISQTIYFNTRSILITPKQNKVKTPDKTEVRGISTVDTASFIQTPFPSPAVSPKPKPTTNYKLQTTNSETELFEALNIYRQKNGQPALYPDSKLQSYAKQRSDYFLNIGRIDNHDGFNNLLKNDGFNKLGFMELAENSSFGYNLSATELIENIFTKSDYHNKNMLNPIYTHIGIGISGSATNFVFGGRKL